MHQIYHRAKSHTEAVQQGDLGHTDLNDDLEFHNSSMHATTTHKHSKQHG